jgi:hypothetical protein
VNLFSLNNPLDAGHNLHYLSEEAAKAWKGLEDTLQIMKIGK